MKNLFTFLLFISLPVVSAQAQSRVSLSPTLWLNYGVFNYQLRYLLSPTLGKNLTYPGNMISGSFGLTARYHIDSSWDVSAGLLYNLESQKAGGIPVLSKYVRLPVLVNYRPSAKRLSPYMSLGASFSNQTRFPFANKRDIKTNALVGLGAYYDLTPKLSLLVQPTISFLVSRPEAQDVSFGKYYFYQVGLQTQLVWNL